LIGTVPAYVLLLGHIAAVGCGIAAVQAMPKTRRPAPFLLAGLTAGCVAFAVLTFLAVDPPYFFWDFRTAYYPAGKMVLEEPALLVVLIGRGVYGFVNLPIVAYLFAPFALLSLRYAIGLFTLIGLAMTVVAWLLLVSVAGLKGAERWLLLLLFVADGPLQYSIKEGNTSHWALAALAGGLYLLRARRPLASAALLGAAAVLKLPLLLFGIYFVLRRDWRSAFGFAGVCLAAGALSVAVFGWDFHVRWFELCVRPFSNQWIGAFNVQSIQSFLFRLQAAPESLRDWAPYPPGAVERLTGYVLVGLLYLGAFLSCIRGSTRRRDEAGSVDDARRDLEFLLVLCLAVVSSPLSWSHYYTWLLLPAAFFLGSESPFAAGSIPRRFGWAAIILAMLLVRPLQFSNPTLMTGYAAIGSSYLLCSGLLWIGLIAWSLMRIGKHAPSTVSLSVYLLSSGGSEAKAAGLEARHDNSSRHSPDIVWTTRRQGSLP
jgi:alpha-1,2-mannosyltransferase